MAQGGLQLKAGRKPSKTITNDYKRESQPLVHSQKYK